MFASGAWKRVPEVPVESWVPFLVVGGLAATAAGAILTSPMSTAVYRTLGLRYDNRARLMLPLLSSAVVALASLFALLA